MRDCTPEHFVSGGYTLSNELYPTASVGEGFFAGSCGYCSQAGARSVNESEGLDLEIDTCAASEIEEVNGEEVISELEFWAFYHFVVKKLNLFPFYGCFKSYSQFMVVLLKKKKF